MTIIVSDTTSLNYLIQIGKVDVMRELFGVILIPPAVLWELQDESAPSSVKVWTRNLPDWLRIVEPPEMDHSLDLDPGEKEAISLAMTYADSIVVIDELKGRNAAEIRGQAVIGTLKVLELAHIKGLLDFNQSVTFLKEIGFRVSNRLVKEIGARIRLNERNEAESG